MEKSKPPPKKKNRGLKCYGPITKLDEHLSPDWWKHIFNPLYLKTDGDMVDDANITSKEVQTFLDILKISTNDKILDLCCGQGRHCLELARRGFTQIEGLDRSHYLIQKARTNSKKECLNIKFREGDARKLQYPNDSFDVVLILGNSFGYFDTIEDDLKVLKEVFRVLKPQGKLLIDVADGEYLREKFQNRSWEWIDKNYFVCRERSLSIDKERIITREVITHVEKGVIADQFYAERLYSKDSLTHFLKEVGFCDVAVEADIFSSSQRNQDLGMLEHRLIFTSIVKKEWSRRKKRTKTIIKRVYVLLGDPKKSDIIKPSCTFDDDDFYTIDELKSGLKNIQNYEFKFLHNHETLVTDLLKNRSNIDLVLNLCDEGFNNDATKELHIPSLLEMLNIPYTGSGPQCLAYCYDKSLVRGVAIEMKIPVAKAFFIKPEDIIFELSFRFPVIVKPNFGDSSFGITQRSVANNVEELMNAISEIRVRFGYEKPILVEEFLTGKDISVGIIGNPPESYTVLPVIEEDYSTLPPELPKICGYEAKWLPNSSYGKIKSIPAQLPKETEKFIIECCTKLFERLECRDYCRFDWRLDSEGNPKLLEVNPNPGWCWDGHLAKMASFSNMSYSEMLEAIIKASEQRLEIKGKTMEKIIEVEKCST